MRLGLGRPSRRDSQTVFTFKRPITSGRLSLGDPHFGSLDTQLFRRSTETTRDFKLFVIRLGANTNDHREFGIESLDS